MDEQNNFQRGLNEKLAQARSKNPSYSLRSFARKLGLTPGALSSILNGKRRVSPKMALRIVERLTLSPTERVQILKGFGGKALHLAKAPSVQLDMDHYRVLADWYHFAILNLVPLAGFKNDPTWLARRLRIRQSEARLAWERIERLGLVEQDEATGTWRRQVSSYRTSDEVRSASLRLSHAQSLDLAKRSLEEDDIHVRDFNAVTLSLHPDQIPHAKQRIRGFLRELTEELESGARTEVYKICLQMFPLSKSLEENS